MSLAYLSVCSGIEAASVAWEPLGFTPAGFAEIEPFPCAVLSHHWPHVMNYGDMLKMPELVAAGNAPAPEILVGGTPCQAFSVAGLRGGLSDTRGALTLSFVRLANAIDDARSIRNAPPCIIVWENVPGVLSSKDNAFGYFLAGLAGEDDGLQAPGKRWANAGVVLGPQRAVAWRTLDAQYFGLAQRRRRVFVIASARNGFDPCAVLFESEGVRRDIAPRREAGETTTHDVAPCVDSSGVGFSRVGDIRGQDPVVAVAGTLNANGKAAGSATQQDAESGQLVVVPILEAGARTGKSTDDPRAGIGIGEDGDPMFTLQSGKQHAVAFGQNRQSGPVDTSHALNGHAGPHGRLDFETETFLVQTACFGIVDDETVMDDCMPTMPTPSASGGGHPPAVATVIAFSAKDHGADAMIDLSPTLRAGGHNESHANAGVMPAIAFHENQRAEITTNDTAGSLKVGGGKPGQGYPAMQQGMAVRRLMPHECERLQGFNDNHTLIPLPRTVRKQRKNEPDAAYAAYLGKAPLAKDGPRYKAIGNSMAVTVMRWIGQRIKLQLQGAH